MADLLADLNAAQREAVTHGTGPLLVLAGAGSGKTRVLTYRIAHLLAAGHARSTEITAVTFTNKAAREMRDRVERLLGGEMRGGFVGTFHRWALEILRRHPRAAGLRAHFAILDRDDQLALISRALKDLGHDPKVFAPRAILARISRIVNRGEGLSAVERRAAHDPGDEVTAGVWRRYRELKEGSGAVDFDDMLALARDVLKREPEILANVRRRGRWLLVDEFQDTNRLQLQLLGLVVDGERNITAVGDEDQSIYRWRGAEMDNILSFEKHFPGAGIVALEQNYRSSRPILEAAGALIANNVMRRGKRLFTGSDGGEPVRVYVGEDERAEARWVGDRIEELLRQLSVGSMAVLMRTNAQTRPFEEELTRRRVPYRVVGGLRFWQRAEVKDALAYLRLVVRPDDTIAFRRVVNVPARGIGAVTLDALEAHSQETGLAVPVAARQLPDSLTPRARQALQRFFELLDAAGEQRDELSPGDLVGWLLEASGLLSLYDGDAEDRVMRRENLQQLAAAVAEAHTLGQSLEEFLDSVALLEEGDDAVDREAVSLMTLHSAKGLEFDAVFLAGLEDGLLPHANSRQDADGLEEERRLAYVGITRSRRWLAVTAARTRFLFGQRHRTQLSAFLLELPMDRCVDVSDASFQWAPEGQPEVRRSSPAARATSPRHLVPGSRRPAGGDVGRPSRVAPTVTDATGTGWRPGDRVRHGRFGTGMVLSCVGRGPQLKLVVYFDRVGRKTLVPTIAKLEKV